MTNWKTFKIIGRKKGVRGDSYVLYIDGGILVGGKPC